MDDKPKKKDVVRSLLGKAKAFVCSTNALVFLLCTALSFFLWLLVSLNRNYEARVTFPVRYDYLPADLECTVDLPETIEVKIKDKGMTLAMELRGKKDTLTLDLSEFNLQADRKITLNTARVFDKKTRELLPPTTVVQEYYPATITLEQIQLDTRRVPVRPLTRLKYARQHFPSDSVSVYPDSVSLFGNRKALDTIRFVNTELIEERGVKDTMRWTAALRTPPGVKAQPGRVTVTAPVEFFTEDSRDVPVLVTGTPDGVVVKLMPAEVTVTYLVGISRFNDVSANEFGITIDYRDLLRSNTSKTAVQLQRSPDYIHAPRLKTDEVQWVIQVVE